MSDECTHLDDTQFDYDTGWSHIDIAASVRDTPLQVFARFCIDHEFGLADHVVVAGAVMPDDLLRLDLALAVGALRAEAIRIVLGVQNGTIDPDDTGDGHGA